MKKKLPFVKNNKNTRRKFKRDLLLSQLKDFFIPHKQNNFHPHIWQPKRVLAHAIVIIIVKLIVVTIALLMPITAFLTPNVLLSESNKIINLTNEIRQNLNLQLLNKNEELRQAAIRKAEDMMINQYFSHIGLDDKTAVSWVKESGYGYSSIGENLALGFSSAEEVVNAWLKSPTHYNNIIDPNFVDIGVAMVAGQYQDYDTTVVAQYFGQPSVWQKEKSFVSGISKNELNKKIEPTLESRSVADHNEEAIKGVKEYRQPISLVRPILINPANNSLTNESEIKFIVFAPEAEIVIIKNADKEIAQIKNLVNGYGELKFQLAEGEYSLTLTAIAGDQKKVSIPYALVVDLTAPKVDQSKTFVKVSEPQGQNNKIVKAQASLSSDVESAYVKFNNYIIELTPQIDDLWTGSLIIFNQTEDQIFNPVVLASLVAQDKAGNQSTVDINWQDIEIVKPSLFKQYFFLKNNQANYTEFLFGFSSIYYIIILVIAIIALLINIFVEARKQHPHIIASALGLIFLLLLLIYI